MTYTQVLVYKPDSSALWPETGSTCYKNRIQSLEHSLISINQLNYLFTVLQSGVKQLLVCQWMSLLECISHKTNFSFPSSLTVLENETSGKTKETFFLGLIHHFHPADTQTHTKTISHIPFQHIKM